MDIRYGAGSPPKSGLIRSAMRLYRSKAKTSEIWLSCDIYFYTIGTNYNGTLEAHLCHTDGVGM
eukprot:scaffold747_cov145-Skeletonema_menzelii.AAC.23